MKIKSLLAIVAAIVTQFAIAIGSASGAPKYVPFGVNFSPYINGQNPSSGKLVIKPSQVANRLAGIHGDFKWIRTTSSTHGMETAGALAHKQGFKAALGASIGPETNAASIANNEDEIVAVVAAANRGEADMVMIGNEAVSRGYVTAAKLISYMQQVRSSIPARIPVSTVDMHYTLMDNPSVVAECDLIMAEFYPYLEGTRIDGAVETIYRNCRDLWIAYQPKPVWIAGTGWPSAGDTIGDAVPSQQNEAFFFTAITSYARAYDVNIFYNEAYDEFWRISSEGPHGSHWGIWSAVGALKPGMSLVFQGNTNTVDIFRRLAPQSSSGLPGQPNVQITSLNFM